MWLSQPPIGGPFPGGHHGGLSLLSGWLPISVQVVAAVLVVMAVGRRGRRWMLWALPSAVVLGGLAVWLTMRYISVNGLNSDPAPTQLWIWIGLTAGAAVVAVLGWVGIGWSRRGLSVLAVALSLLCVGLALNDWVGYFPTVSEAWGQLTNGPLPDQVDQSALAGVKDAGTRNGRLVGVDIPDTVSHFPHREEYVYLPPAWFVPGQVALPVLMMIGGEFNTPADWIRVGNAVQTADSYARQHHGVAPVLVFVDSGGTFNNNTECVNGPRGNAAEHLTAEVRPYVISHFHTAVDPAHWGIVGWSSGGTCAVDLAVMHPELFDTFEDIAGDIGPNVGDKQRTIAGLYGGDATAWAAFDPLTVLARHAPYPNTQGWFDNASGPAPGSRPRLGHWSPWRGRRPPQAGGGQAGFGGHYKMGGPPANEAAAASQLCAAARAKRIGCTLHTQPGMHSWQFAATAFTDALPWLATRMGVG